MNYPVFDLHCDTALALLDDYGLRKSRLNEQSGHIDLKRGRQLHGYCQVFALFTTPGMDFSGKATAVQLFDAMLRNILAELAENKDTITQVS